MTVKISKPAINLREELASLRNQGGLPKEDKLYLDGLVSNGNFGTSSDWILGTGWSISGGLLRATNANDYTTATQFLKTVAGKTYEAIVKTESLTSGAFRLYIHDGSSMREYVNINAVGTHKLRWTAHTDSDQVRFYCFDSNNPDTATFSDIAVYEVGENLVTNGTFDNGTTGWVAENGATATVTNGELVVGDGAGLYSRVKQEINMPENRTYTLSVQARVGTGTSFDIRLANSSSSTAYGSHLAQTVSGTYNLTFTPNAGEDIKIYLYSNSSDNGGTAIFDNITVTEGNHNVIQSIPYGYDVKDVYIDGELAREGEAYDYQVQTDGINQWLKPTVEPTATTETVVIGVRK